MKARKGETRVVVGSIATFEIVQWISAGINCEKMEDLPNNMQDKIYAALEVKAQQMKMPLAIVSVRCGEETEPPDDQHRWYLHIVASEVIAADSRKITVARN